MFGGVVPTPAKMPLTLHMDEDIQYWLRLAHSDMVSAEILHRAGQESHSLFFLQQAIEKTLKALVVKQTQSAPPRIHNLPKLAERCGLKVANDQIRLLKRLDRSYTESRYPEAWGETHTEISGSDLERLMSATKEFLAWLKQKL